MKKSWKYIVVAILGLGLFVSGVLSYSIGSLVSFCFYLFTFIFGDLYFTDNQLFVFRTPEDFLLSFLNLIMMKKP